MRALDQPFLDIQSEKAQLKTTKTDQGAGKRLMELIPYKVQVVRAQGARQNQIFDWNTHKGTIKRLYIDEKKSLNQVMKIMADAYDFHATVKMYKTKLKRWGYSKNRPRSQISLVAQNEMSRLAPFVSLPEVYGIPDVIFRCIKDHVFGSFDARKWKITSEMVVSSREVGHNILAEFRDLIMAADRFFQAKKLQQTFVLIHKACALVPAIIHCGKPRFLVDVMDCIRHFHGQAPEIAKIMLNQFAEWSKLRLEQSNPLVAVFGKFIHSDPSNFEWLLRTAIICCLEQFDQVIGRYHPAALQIWSFWTAFRIGGTDLESRLREVLRKCQTKYANGSRGVLLPMTYLAEYLCQNKRDNEAEELLSAILREQNRKRSMNPMEFGSVNTTMEVNTNRWLACIHHDAGRQGFAERHLREAIDLMKSILGQYNSSVLQHLSVLQRWLIEWGHQSSADDVGREMEEILTALPGEDIIIKSYAQMGQLPWRLPIFKEIYMR